MIIDSTARMALKMMKAEDKTEGSPSALPKMKEKEVH